GVRRVPNRPRAGILRVGEDGRGCRDLRHSCGGCAVPSVKGADVGRRTMKVQRAFTAEPGFTPDFFRVREFLRRLNAGEVRAPGFLWGRWEWAFCLPLQDQSALDRIGVWESDGEIV